MKEAKKIESHPQWDISDDEDKEDNEGTETEGDSEYDESDEADWTDTFFLSSSFRITWVSNKCQDRFGENQQMVLCSVVSCSRLPHHTRGDFSIASQSLLNSVLLSKGLVHVQTRRLHVEVSVCLRKLIVCEGSETSCKVFEGSVTSCKVFERPRNWWHWGQHSGKHLSLPIQRITTRHNFPTLVQFGHGKYANSQCEWLLYIICREYISVNRPIICKSNCLQIVHKCSIHLCFRFLPIFCSDIWRKKTKKTGNTGRNT